MAGTYSRLNSVDLGRIFQPQQQLEIAFNVVNGEKTEQASFTTKVINLGSDRVTLMFLNDAEVKLNLIEVGRVITVHAGRASGIFTFKSKILNRLYEDGLKITIEIPQVLANKDRRTGKRVPYTTSITYYPLLFKGKPLPELENKKGYGESQDISKGGITILTDLKLPVGLTLRIELNLEGNIFPVVGLVRRVQSVANQKKSYAVGIKFVDTDANPQEARTREMVARMVDQNGQRLHGSFSL